MTMYGKLDADVYSKDYDQKAYRLMIGSLLYLCASRPDIMFGCTNQKYSDEFGYMMQEQYQMSVMGELKFFLRLQIRQQHNSIFISQEKYLKDCLKKFGMQDCKGYTTPMPTRVIRVPTPMVKSLIKRYTAP